MSNRIDERGGGGIKGFIIIAIVLYGVYAGIRIAAARADDASIKHEAETAMKYAGINKEDEKAIHYKIMKVAREKDIPLAETDLHVLDQGAEWNTKFTYQRDIDLVFWNYKYPVEFQESVPKG